MCQEEDANEEHVRAHHSIEQRRELRHAEIRRLVDRGWPEERAAAYTLLAPTRNAMARALRSGSDCYAASTYTVSERSSCTGRAWAARSSRYSTSTGEGSTR